MSDKPTAEVWVVWYWLGVGWKTRLARGWFYAEQHAAQVKRSGAVEVRIDRLVSTLPERENDNDAGVERIKEAQRESHKIIRYSQGERP